MKQQGNRKKQSGTAPLGKLSSKNGGSSKYGPNFKDKRQVASQKASSSQKIYDEASPSQHLWVGNVSSVVTETTFAELFSRFGDIESLKLHSSKNYAFVSLKTVEDAVYAKKGLHGTLLGGLAIRIEFAKGDSKLNNQSQLDENVTSEEKRVTDESIMSQDKGPTDGKIMPQETKPTNIQANVLDGGSRQTSEKPKSNKNGDPSEVLWIGFPLHLRIDERKLHKLFAPFGGVEKITTFPGRTYAFVRFQNVKAASRAKDALQGKLFNDPRVSISFAKSEVGPVDHSQGTSKVLPSSPVKVEVGTRTLPSPSPVKGEVGTSMFPSPSSVKGDVKASKHPSSAPVKKEVPPPICPISKAGNVLNPRDEKHLGLGPHKLESPPLSTSYGIAMNEAVFSPSSPDIKPQLEGDLSKRPSLKHGLNSETDLGSPGIQKGAFPHSKTMVLEERWSMHEEVAGKREQKRQRVGDGHPIGEAFSKFGSLVSSNDRSPLQEEDAGKEEPKRERVGDGYVSDKAVSKLGFLEASNGRSPLQDAKFIAEAESKSAIKEMNVRYREDWEDQEVHKKGLLGRMPLPSSIEETTVPLGSQENWEKKEGLQKGLLGKMPLPGSNLDQFLGSNNEPGLSGAPIRPPPKYVFRWEGIIAKGGAVVCHCRCFPATKEIDVTFPDVLNCTARTSLDILANYITQVRDFAVVLFMPQGVTDVAPYQELMAFLADKKRAAVCKISQENTLFLVPPSDFVEQFLNVPKSNNILGVVLGQQQLQTQFSQTLADQTVFFQPKQMLLIDDLKEQSYQKPEVHASSEHLVAPVAMTVQSSTEIKNTQPSFSQQTSFQLSRSGGSSVNPGMSASVGGMGQSPSGKSLVRIDNSVGRGVVMDKNKVTYQTQGSNPSSISDSNRLAYQTKGRNPLLDSNRGAYQTQGNNPMPHDLHVTGGLSLPLISKLPSHQDTGMPSHPQLFFSPHSSASTEQQPVLVPGYGQGGMTTIDSQNLSGSLPFHEQPRPPPFPPSTMQLPQSAPLAQLKFPLVHQQESFTYGPEHSQPLPLSFDGGQQEPRMPSSNFAFKPAPSNATSMQPPHPPAPPFDLRQPHPSAPPFHSQDKQTLLEAEQHKGIQMAQQRPLAESQGRGEPDEDQKKFQATLELAAALLQQLQQQTKL